jgi:aminoethylphosphonate catabolism LysR family transcriptional regulator
MRTFYAVAREGSFTAAAKVLHVSQPTLTSQVRDLETTYGVRLFRRHGRGVELTDTGRTLLSIAHRIISNQQDAMEFLKAVNGLQAGHLKIGAVGPYQAAQILAVFHEKYPGIEISVKFGNSRQILEDVIDYRSDIGIVGRHEDHSELLAFEYSEPQLIVIVPKSHPWSRRRRVRLAELARQKMIRREPGSLTRRVFESALQRENVEVETVMEIGSKEGVVAAVARGIGIGIISEEEHIPGNYVHALAIADIDLRMKVHIICHADRKDERLIRPIFDVAADLAGQRS